MQKMNAIYSIAPAVVFIIGVMLVVKHYRKGWGQSETLTGIAFVLISLPSVLSMLGLY